MNIYIDCISGVSHLTKLSNERFRILKSDLDASKLDPEMRIIDLFEACYFKNQVESKCSRRVIAYKDLVDNIKNVIDNLDSNLVGEYTIKNIIAAAYKGIWDNCAQGEYYLPKGN